MQESRACAPGDEALAARARDLADLDRLQDIAMELAEVLRRRVMAEEPSGRGGTGDPILALSRLCRTVRQIMVLREEFLGLRSPPAGRMAVANDFGQALVAPQAEPEAEATPDAGATDPGAHGRRLSDDLRERNDLNDYDNRPLPQVMESLRGALLREAARFPEAAGALDTLRRMEPQAHQAGSPVAAPKGGARAASPTPSGRAALLSGASKPVIELAGSPAPWRPPDLGRKGRPQVLRGPPRR